MERLAADGSNCICVGVMTDVGGYFDTSAISVLIVSVGVEICDFDSAVCFRKDIVVYPV